MLRAVGVLTLASLLSGPAPGSVGACDEQAVFVEAEAFCRAREGALCEREFQRSLRGLVELQSEEQRDDCLQDAADRCAGALYPPGCFPTERERDRCLGALRSVARIEEPADSIAECRAASFCGPDFEPAETPDGGSP